MPTVAFAVLQQEPGKVISFTYHSKETILTLGRRRPFSLHGMTGVPSKPLDSAQNLSRVFHDVCVTWEPTMDASRYAVCIAEILMCTRR